VGLAVGLADALAHPLAAGGYQEAAKDLKVWMAQRGRGDEF